MNQIVECTPEEIQMIYRRLRQLKKEISQQIDKEELIARERKRDLIQSGKLREITLLVQGHQYFHESGKPSSYEYILIDKNTGKMRRKISDKMENETANRAIIYGIMDAINRLSKDKLCRIQVVTKTPWGFLKMQRKNKGVNRDLLEKLNSLIRDSGHILEAYESKEMINQYFNNLKINPKGS